MQGEKINNQKIISDIVIPQINELYKSTGVSLTEELINGNKEEVNLHKADKQDNQLIAKSEVLSDTIQKPIEGEKLNYKKTRYRLPPIKRGGRSRIQSTEDKGGITRRQNRPNLKPSISSLGMDIICWDDSQWFIGLELHRRLRNVEVFQGGRRLNPCNYYNTRFVLENQEEIKIVFNGEERIFPSPLGKEKYYIFKMKKDWASPGRLVSTINKGNYIIMTPNDWIRDEELNPAPFGEDFVGCWGLTAHYFYINRNSKVSFTTAEGKKVDIKINDYIELEGEQIIDDSDMGPLFIHEVPVLKVSSEDYWDSVSVIIIGREGRGTNRWKIEFKPARVCAPKLPKKLEERAGGWYYLRIYDQDERLRESLDFRYSKGLHEIITPPYCSPSSNGYKPVQIEFYCAANCDVIPEKHSDLMRIENSDIITYEIPPSSLYDQTDWVIVDGGFKISVRIILDRIWWVVDSKSKSLNDFTWQAQALLLAPEDFYATSDKVIWIKVTKPPKSRKIQLRLSGTFYRNYSIPVDNLVKIPLSDFTDSMDWNNFIGSADLELLIPEKDDIGIKLASIYYEFNCKWCVNTFSAKNDLILHVIKDHLNEFFRLLRYEEMQKYMPELPKSIYRCSYCGYFVGTNDLDNPTSKITNHVERCKKAYNGEFSSQLKFRVITNLNEIRENVVRNLPEMYECLLCPLHNKEVIRESKLGGKTARISHLLKHKEEIVKLCRKRW